MKVEAWAQEKRGDDLVGAVLVDISESLRTGEFDGQFRNWIAASL